MSMKSSSGQCAAVCFSPAMPETHFINRYTVALGITQLYLWRLSTLQVCRCHEYQCHSSVKLSCMQVTHNECGCDAQVWFARQYKAYQPNTLLLDNALATMGAGMLQQ